MPDDHSKSVPPLPIPNRTVKRLCADDSAATSVKVGYRQASYKRKPPQKCGGFFRLPIRLFLSIRLFVLLRYVVIQIKAAGHSAIGKSKSRPQCAVLALLIEVPTLA